MSQRVYYLVLIELHAGMADVLRRYEVQAARVMQRHGGRFVQVFRPLGAGGGNRPDEVHLLAFESEQDFAAFRADPELDAIGQLRDAAVKAARVLALYAIPLDAYLTPGGG